MRRGSVLIVLGVAALGAITLAACLLPATEQLGGDTADASVNADVLAPDGAPDGTPEASPDGPLRHFCEDVDAEVCEDMDEDASLYQWTFPDGGVFRTDASASSPPFSLEIVDFEDAGCLDRKVRRFFNSATTTGVHVEGDVWEESMTSGEFDWYMTIQLGSGGKSCLVFVGYDGTGKQDVLRVQHNDGGGTYPTVVQKTVAWTEPPGGHFRHFVVEFVNQDGGALSWSIDGKPGFGAVPMPSNPCVGETLGSVGLGVHCGSDSAYRFRFDNVTIRRF